MVKSIQEHMTLTLRIDKVPEEPDMQAGSFRIGGKNIFGTDFVRV